jgi:hypothetical protein
MKVVALAAALLTGGVYIDSQYHHGQYLRAVIALTQQIAVHMGLRR